jgi:hypothetical protein
VWPVFNPNPCTQRTRDSEDHGDPPDSAIAIEKGFSYCLPDTVIVCFNCRELGPLHLDPFTNRGGQA